MYATYVEDYQKQFSEWQKQFMSTWMNTVPMGQAVFEFPNTVNQAIEYQEKFIQSYLEAQATASQIALDNQKKFWEGYFNLARQSLSTVDKAA
jgi:hypothetical protein